MYEVTRKSYEVTTTHLNGYLDGTHKFTVNTVKTDKGIHRYVDAPDYGCSRDYYVSNDEEAIKALLAEHATTVVSIKKSK